MRISSLNFTSAQPSNLARKRQRSRNNESKIELGFIPDTTIVGYRVWKDGNTYPETAGQLRARLLDNQPKKRIVAIVEFD